MAFTRFPDPTNNISNLANQPVEPPATLKQKFDQAGEDLKDWNNNTFLPELESTTNGDSGADNIGATALSGGVATTVQGIVEELDTTTVKLTGNQTIAGVKTFSSSPIVPTATTATQAINLAQLEAHVIDQIPDDSLTNDLLATDVKVGSLATLNALLVGFTSSVTVAINKVVSWIGDLSTLTTTVKTSLVGSINEVDADVALKANKVQEAWIAPTLLNSWVNFDPAIYVTAGYYKDEFGVVHVKGTIKNGTSDQVMFILPAGYRRTLATLFTTNANGVFGVMTVRANGEVICGASVSTTYRTLDGISFRAEA